MQKGGGAAERRSRSLWGEAPKGCLRQPAAPQSRFYKKKKIGSPTFSRVSVYHISHKKTRLEVKKQNLYSIATT